MLELTLLMRFFSDLNIMNYALAIAIAAKHNTSTKKGKVGSQDPHKMVLALNATTTNDDAQLDQCITAVPVSGERFLWHCAAHSH
jgi:hypothetical protein